MILELPEELETALKVKANARGVSPAGYVCEVLKRDMASTAESESEGSDVPFQSSFGILAKYGPAPSAEEIDENRAEMFRGFGEALTL